MTPSLKTPSAWLPIAMPLAMLAFILIYISTYGIVRQEDEGTPAHIFQIWMVVEVLAVAFFAVTWFPRNPKQTFIILALQIAASLLPIALVFFLES
ncbi:MAG: hypothetical protein AAB490_02220 [Patescibacteria group bacterium]